MLSQSTFCLKYLRLLSPIWELSPQIFHSYKPSHCQLFLAPNSTETVFLHPLQPHQPLAWVHSSDHLNSPSELALKLCLANTVVAANTATATFVRLRFAWLQWPKLASLCDLWSVKNFGGPPNFRLFASLFNVLQPLSTSSCLFVVHWSQRRFNPQEGHFWPNYPVFDSANYDFQIFYCATFNFGSVCLERHLGDDFRFFTNLGANLCSPTI